MTVAPLDSLPEDRRREIERLAAGDECPPRWLNLAGAQVHSRAWYEWHIRRGRDPFALRRAIPARVRRRVLARDGFVCGICRRPVAPDDVHLDHILPVARGGRNIPSNLQVTHSLCNMRKGAR